MTSILFDKNRHEPLTNNVWDKAFVQTAITTIIDDIEQSLLPDACWPTHPLDAQSYSKTGPKWAAYAGAAGTVHALQMLRGYSYKINDLSGLLPVIHTSYLKNPDVSIEPGLQMGEIGLLMPAILSQPDNKIIADQLMQCMEKTIELPLYEITSGQTGMMHAALALYRKTACPIAKRCWKDLYIRGAESLLKHWKQDPATGQWLWQSQIFGPSRHYYGACHGVVGNANILLQGVDLLPENLTNMIINRTVTTLQLSAQQNTDMANWPLCTKPDINKLLVQWCHGAAGIVTAMAKTPKIDSSNTRALDDLLQKTAELVWQAGPLIKGSNICHGTAGNGYAFLYLYQRCGDPIWLDRARKFAIHAIEQCQTDRQHYGQGRYTLWTGDAGLAIYLHHCLFPEIAAIPGLDLF